MKSLSGFPLPLGDYAEFWAPLFISCPFLYCCSIPATATSFQFPRQHALMCQHVYPTFPLCLRMSFPRLFSIPIHLVYCLFFFFTCPLSLNLKRKWPFSNPSLILHSVSVPLVWPKLRVYDTWHALLLITYKTEMLSVVSISFFHPKLWSLWELKCQFSLCLLWLGQSGCWKNICWMKWISIHACKETEFYRTD